MVGGYTGKILFVDLSKPEITVETPDEKLYEDFIGGYGIGARIIYSRQAAGADPLGPENILGFVTGPLTGSPAICGSRYTVVAKSPLTGTWGDANSGGEFGPYLKFAGFDAVFFSGLSEVPVYLLIDNGNVEIRDAEGLWGLDSNETEDRLKKAHGAKAQIACIGQAGERLALISCIMNNKGRAAGRSGLGAVMGSKRLKAIVATGNHAFPIARQDQANSLKKKYLSQIKGPAFDRYHNYGTCAGMSANSMRGDAPVKNWGGVGSRDFPNSSAISDVNVIERQTKRYACYKCPFGCGGHMKAGEEYDYEEGAHKPEYETLASFGSMCLNDNLESIIMCNDLCNRYGLDTISAGAVIAFAIECYENGIITKEDTGGLDLTWGHDRAIVALTELIGKRRGFGYILGEGVKVAAERIGRGSEKYAVHVEGQEPGMHDPKLTQGWGPSYKIDATPGRHTQGSEVFLPSSVQLADTENKGERHKAGSNIVHVVNASGLCLFGFMGQDANNLPDFMSAVTGMDCSFDSLLKQGERIANIRQAFNLREGLNPLEFKLPARMVGDPPLDAGPTEGVTLKVEERIDQYLDSMGWDKSIGRPSKAKLMELGLDDVVEDLWPASGEAPRKPAKPAMTETTVKDRWSGLTW